MTGLQSVTDLPIAWIRSALEITVIAGGWLLVGTVGLGTRIVCVGIGPAMSASMYFLDRYSASNSRYVQT